MLLLSPMLMCVCDLSLLLAFMMGGFLRVVLLSMMFTVALYLPWCRYLAAQVGVQPQLYADNLKCVSKDPGLLLNAARFMSGCLVRSLLPVSVSF